MDLTADEHIGLVGLAKRARRRVSHMVDSAGHKWRRLYAFKCHDGVPTDRLKAFLFFLSVQAPFLVVVGGRDAGEALQKLQVFILDPFHLATATIETSEKNMVWLTRFLVDRCKRFHFYLLHAFEENLVVFFDPVYPLVVELNGLSIVYGDALVDLKILVKHAGEMRVASLTRL